MISTRCKLIYIGWSFWLKHICLLCLRLPTDYLFNHYVGKKGHIKLLYTFNYKINDLKLF